MQKLLHKTRLHLSKPKLSFKRRYTQEKEYLDHFLLLFCLGIIWISSALIGIPYPNVGMLLFFLGITLFKPMIFEFRKIFKNPFIHEDSPLRMVNTCMVIGVPAGVVLGFYFFVDNINHFYPAFSVLIGIILGIVGYVFRLKTYGIISLIIISGGVYIGYTFHENFVLGGIFTGTVFLVFALATRILAAKNKTTKVMKESEEPIIREINRSPLSNKKSLPQVQRKGFQLK